MSDLQQAAGAYCAAHVEALADFPGTAQKRQLAERDLTIARLEAEVERPGVENMALRGQATRCTCGLPPCTGHCEA